MVCAMAENMGCGGLIKGYIKRVGVIGCLELEAQGGGI